MPAPLPRSVMKTDFRDRASRRLLVRRIDLRGGGRHVAARSLIKTTDKEMSLCAVPDWPDAGWKGKRPLKNANPPAMAKLQVPSVTLLNRYQGSEFRPIYSTKVTAHGGEAEHGRASGIVRSDDGSLDLALRLPPELGGEGGGTNPEQLFAAAFAACFHGALNLLAGRSGIAIRGSSVQVSVALGRDPVDGLFALSADVRIALPGIEKSLAEELVRSTERFCPYAKMARNGFTSIVTLATQGGELA